MIKHRLLWLFILASLLLACGTTEETATCDEAGFLFRDGFVDNRCGWLLYQDSGATVAIEEEVLTITSNQPGQIWWTNPGREFDDVIVAVEARQIDGPDNNAYGVICRYQSEENFYVFLVSGDGYYAIGKYQTGSEQITYLLDGDAYQFSDVINQGVATNQIRASCVGNELGLSVNGIPLATVTDNTFVRGDIGLGASPLEAGTTIIHFDDIEVLAP